MQKVLTQMNIQLANVISDLSGWTGQRVVRAILAGERDPDTLAALSHPGIHATRCTIAKSLEGTWQPDLLFVLRNGTRPVINRAATALRLAATTLLRSQSYLGAQYRRLRTRLGAPKAITAMAHKLARLVYRLLKWGHEYVDNGLKYYEDRHRQQQLQLLKKKAAKLGFQLVEPQAAA